MAAPQLFKLAGRIASRMADKSADSGLPRIEKIFGTPPRVPSPTTIEKIARSDEAFARGPVEYSRYRGPMEEVDEVILDAPLSRPERDYFANISKSGSGFTEKKLTAKDVEFFEDMMREGDPYDFMADIPSAKIRTDKKGNKYLRVQGEEDMNNLFKFIMDGPWDKGDLPPSLRRWDWDRSFKDVKEFKHGGGLSSINKPITINGQRHNLAWIRPDEASALKAMGGSGKKVDGIPAYFDEHSWGESDIFDTTSTDPTPTTSDDTHGTSSEDLERHGAAYGVQRSLDPETATGYLESYGGDEFVPQRITSESLREKGVPDKLVPYWNALKDRGMSNQAAADYLAGMEADQLASMSSAYDTGYSFGGPMGTMQGLTRDMAIAYAEKLKLKELEDEIENLDDKLSSEERTAQIRDIFSRYDIPELGTLTARKDLKGMGSDIEATAIKQGINPTIAKALSWAAPGKTWTDLIAGAGNALARAFGVRGEFETEGGKTFRVMRGGELVEPDMAAIPTEDSPEPVTEIARAVAPTTEVVAEAGPMEAYQTGLQSIESNEGIENSIQILMDQYGISEGEARVMLGLDVNIA